jgi:hypothetical protein
MAFVEFIGKTATAMTSAGLAKGIHSTLRKGAKEGAPDLLGLFGTHVPLPGHGQASGRNDVRGGAYFESAWIEVAAVAAPAAVGAASVEAAVVRRGAAGLAWVWVVVVLA